MDLCEEITRSTSVSGQLHRLYTTPSCSSEFELAFAEFYDNVKREKIVDSLHGEKLQEFVDFLDEVRDRPDHPALCLTVRPGATV